MKKYFDDIANVREFPDHKRNPTEQELREVPAMTRAEFIDLARTAEYKQSPLIQKLAYAAVTKSSEDYVGNALRIGSGSQTQSGDQQEGQTQAETKVPFQILEARQAKLKAMFRDPRYKTDAAYRLEVQEFLQGHAANDAPVDEKIMRQGGGVTQVGFSTKLDEGAAFNTVRQHSYQVPFTPTGPNKPAPKPKVVDPHEANTIHLY